MFKINGNNQPDNEILKKYRIDSAFGCYTRNALEMEIWPVVKEQIRYIIFADVDEMRVANQKFGYAQTDRKIRKAITAREGDIVVARWYSGDELVFFLLDGPRVGDPTQYAQRVQGRLHQAGLSATFGVVELERGKKARLAEAVGRASGLVQKTKAGGVRDCILTEPMTLSTA